MARHNRWLTTTPTYKHNAMTDQLLAMVITLDENASSTTKQIRRFTTVLHKIYGNLNQILCISMSNLLYVSSCSVMSIATTTMTKTTTTKSKAQTREQLAPVVMSANKSRKWKSSGCHMQINQQDRDIYAVFAQQRECVCVSWSAHCWYIVCM